MKIHISDVMLDELREKIKPYLKHKRYNHTLAVEEEVACLGEIYLPEDVNRLRAAALLHDITKKLDLSEHLQICKDFDIMVGDQPEKEEKLFHSKTAPLIIKENFEGYYDDDILSAVRWHTTGRKGMTVFESLVYLADYIEKTRTFDDCVVLRKYFYDELDKGEYPPAEVLRKTMVMSFDMTISNLIEENGLIDLDTISARNSFVLNDCFTDIIKE